MKATTTMMRVAIVAACLIISPLARAQDAPQVTQLTDHVYTVFLGVL